MGFPYAPLDFVEIDWPPAAGQFNERQLLEGNSSFFKHRQRAAFELSVAFDHPQYADGIKELLLPPRLVLAPKLHGARRHLRIRLTRTVRSAHHPRLTARG